MPLKKYLLATLFAASTLMAADNGQATPYDLIRPVWPLTWDTTVFDRFDTTVTTKHNMVPRNRKPAAYAPNQIIPDTLNQAYLDAMNVRMSPIRVNQAGYMEDDNVRQFYYIGSATTFEVVDVDGKSLSPAVTGTFSPTGSTITSDWTIIAGTNAATNDQKRYQVDITGQSGMVQRGNIPLGLQADTRYRIKVGNDFSSTFIISNKVYSMVRSAALKFYGINRSGYGDSWFHPASHTLDGAGPVTNSGEDLRDHFDASLAGTLEGGYYDCGDHLKESQTQMYAFMVAAVMAATNPDADDDYYAFNQNEALNTDGIPDMLREAKHGADYVLRAYVRAKGVIDDMALSVGNFGSDHGWWGRPENQDKLPVDGSAAATGRGGPMSRTVRLGEIGSNIGGETAAGLAILSKNYREFDPAFADSCLMVAEKMYDFAKALAQGKSSYDGGKPFVNNKEAAGWSSPAYNGNNEFYDDMALASVALLYATGKKEYADDMIRTRNLVAGQEYMENCAGCFEGGWFVTNDKGFLKNVKNTSWANAYAYATYALYKLILADKNKALTEYGLTEQEWLNAIEDCVMSMIYNLSDVSAGSETITLPRSSSWQDIGWKGNVVKYDPLWFSMQTDQTWIYNRYQAGNIFEVLAYADVAKDIQEKGLVLPLIGAPDWKADEMHQLGINQLNYLLGVNPWDVSYILGIGDKNDAHPHHRAANPEGKNQPGANYKYNPPVGALYGGVTPGLTNSMVPDNKSWEDYHKSETCIDAAATLVSSGALAAAKFDRTAAPKVSVEIRHVSMDSAIVMVKLTTRGTATIAYGTAEGQYTLSATDGEKGTQHEIILRGLDNGTTYYFYAIGQNAYNEMNFTEKYMVDSTKAPYTFTTLNTVESAQIANVTVCNLQGDSAEIMWYTPNGEYESKIYWDTVAHASASEYAFNSGKGNADVSGIPTKFHYVKIGGLKEKTTYYYMVESNGVQTNVDEKGNLLKFTTPVMWYDFSVRTYQYEFGGMDFLNANVYNNEARAFDSLTLRLYFTALPEEVEKCATLIDSDICQAYDEAGFNKPCENDRELRDLLRAALPVRLDDTYDPKTGKYSYYFPAPLGSSTIKSQSRLRIDFGFSSGMSNDGYKTCETLRKPGTKRFRYDTGDWSWRPHTFQEDGADYAGMPLEDKDYGDIDNEIPVNPYIAVYRKDEFIWGYSPSYQEMSTKKAHYEIDVAYDAPFNVSDGSYVQIDQTSSIVYVTGHAFVSESGFITKIWANGDLVDAKPVTIEGERYLASSTGVIVAHYNSGGFGSDDQDSTGLWTLNIPVKMGIGSNKVDITLFAGPDPECEACSENGGCAFVNRSYYVQFTRGNLTASALTIKDEAGAAISSPAEPGNTKFKIYLTDKDKANYKGDLNVLVVNNKKGDTLKVKMVEVSGNPGYFESANFISAESIAKEKRTNVQISFFSGDEIQVIYQDPDDEEDQSKQSFYSESNYPAPQKVLAQDTDCDNKADKLLVQFTNPLDEAYRFDSIRVFISGMADTMTLKLDASAFLDQSDILIDLPESLGIETNASPSGVATVYLAADGATSAERVNITDGIAPQLLSVTILENPNHESEQDTLMIAFTEPVMLSSATTFPIEVMGILDAPISVVGKASTSNDGKSWLFVVTGNTDGLYLPIGGTAVVKGTVTDKAFNPLIPSAACATVKIVETPKPVPVTLAEMRDLEGDGYPDELYMKFEKKLRDKDMLDSFVVEWGSASANPKSFLPETWTHSIETGSHWDVVTNVDSSGLEPVVTQDSILVDDTVSVITIKIPTGNSYPKGATNGPFDGYGHVTPRLGPEGGFFDKFYVVVDKCPPIIVSASKESSGEVAFLSVKMSEPLLESDDPSTDYIERKRTGNMDSDRFLKPTNAIASENKYTFSYKDDASDAIRVGDQIRLVPESMNAKFQDKASNAPTEQNPWVTVNGTSAEKVRFVVNMGANVTMADPTVIPYVNLPPEMADYPFVLTVTDAEGKLNFLTNDNGSWSTSGFKTQDSTYGAVGPVFKISVVMPSATLAGNSQEFFYDFELSIALDLYDNLGQFINNQKVSIPTTTFNQLRPFISESGELNLNLEWLAKDGEAPVSSAGRKIGSGPYIAKFDFKATSYCTETVDGKMRDDGLSCEIGKDEKITDTNTKTFGFKRSKR